MKFSESESESEPWCNWDDGHCPCQINKKKYISPRSDFNPVSNMDLTQNKRKNFNKTFCVGKSWTKDSWNVSSNGKCVNVWVVFGEWNKWLFCWERSGSELDSFQIWHNSIIIGWIFFRAWFVLFFLKHCQAGDGSIHSAACFFLEM